MFQQLASQLPIQKKVPNATRHAVRIYLLNLQLAGRSQDMQNRRYRQNCA